MILAAQDGTEKTEHLTTSTEHTLEGLQPDTEYIVRVHVWGDKKTVGNMSFSTGK